MIRDTVALKCYQKPVTRVAEEIRMHIIHSWVRWWHLVSLRKDNHKPQTNLGYTS